jgi:hypothetical protein
MTMVPVFSFGSTRSEAVDFKFVFSLKADRTNTFKGYSCGQVFELDLEKEKGDSQKRKEIKEVSFQNYQKEIKFSIHQSEFIGECPSTSFSRTDIFFPFHNFW